MNDLRNENCDECGEPLELGFRTWSSYTLKVDKEAKAVYLHDGECTEKYLKKLKEGKKDAGTSK